MDEKVLPVKFAKVYFALTPEERKRIAWALDSSVGYLRHIAHGRKVIRLGFADALLKLVQLYGVEHGGSKLTLKDLPLSKDAVRQNEIRQDSTKLYYTCTPTKQKPTT